MENGGVRILFINNDGGGFASHVTVPDGTTVAQFVSQNTRGRSASDFKVRVNREATLPEYVLQEGDRVSITPVKISGAR